MTKIVAQNFTLTEVDGVPDKKTGEVSIAQKIIDAFAGSSMNCALVELKDSNGVVISPRNTQMILGSCVVRMHGLYSGPVQVVLRDNKVYLLKREQNK